MVEAENTPFGTRYIIDGPIETPDARNPSLFRGLVMEVAGIKRLKARLSEYAGKVRRGDRIVITDRGLEVAEMIPISRERQAVKLLAEEGRLRWDGGKPAGLKGVKVRGKTVAETVIEDRR